MTEKELERSKRKAAHTVRRSQTIEHQLTSFSETAETISRKG